MEDDNLSSIEYFTDDRISFIEKYIYDKLINNMLDYRCDGCRWCCYGDPEHKDRCEKIYTDNELPKYLDDYEHTFNYYLVKTL